MRRTHGLTAFSLLVLPAAAALGEAPEAIVGTRVLATDIAGRAVYEKNK